MSNIDTIRLKAANAGSKPVGITGAELLSVMNYIAEQGNAGLGTVTSVGTVAPLSGTVTTSGSLTTSMATNKLIGRGTAGTGVMEEITLGTGLSFTGTTLNAATGLATTGATTGGTAFNQEFSKGVTVGAASSENGVLNFFNSTGATQVVVSSTAAKQLLIDNTGHDVEIGINGAAVAGKALTVTGRIRTTDRLEVGDDTTTIRQSAADAMLLTASDGVTTSAGLTVGEGLSTKTQTITADTTLDATMHTIIIDDTAGAIVLTPPSAASHTGREYYIVAAIVVNGISLLGLANGNYTFNAQYESLIIQSDGTSWHIISKYTP